MSLPAELHSHAHERSAERLSCLETARQQTDALFGILSPQALYDRPVAQRHRFIFYVGHVEAFDWNLISSALGMRAFHPSFDKLFAFGIDPDSSHLPADQPSDWPSLDEVMQYRDKCRERLEEAFNLIEDELFFTALEHRLMHAETLAYLLHNVPYDQKRSPGNRGAVDSRSKIEQQWRNIPAGIATLGRSNGFGWDNEFAEHQVHAGAFRAQKFKVTNGDYLEFVKAGGTPSIFWYEEGGNLYLRGMFERVPLPPTGPVYVTHQQATAYAAWAGKRLMSEAEYHRAAFGTPEGAERCYPWGDEAPSNELGNFDFAAWDPVPVDAHPAGESAFGVAQLAGNGWEWTSTPFGPFEGFKERAYYPGYSKDFFDGEHFVLKGASPRTAARFLRRSFRNWFRADYPYAYATFRLAESL
jgi:formylglycine-generating enzyme required for sulfatase activity